MKELSNVIAAAFDNIVASGAIEKAIEEKLQETIVSAVNDQLKSYSDFGKAIKEKVAQVVNVNMEHMDLPSYGDLVMKILRRQLDAHMQGEFAQRLEADMAALLETAPAEITLESIIEKFIDAYKEDRAGEDFTLRIENDGGSFTYIGLDKEPNQSEYECDFRIGVHQGEVFNLRLNGDDVQKKMFVGPLRGFEKLLFQMYTAKTKLVIPDDADASDYTRSFPYDD